MTDDVAIALRAVVETGLLLCDAIISLEPGRPSPALPAVVECATVDEALRHLLDACDFDSS